MINLKNQQARILRLNHDGKGVSNIQNKTIFINGGLVNENVRFQVVKKHKTFDEAEIITIQEPSPDRVSPPCEHFGICGGCSLQHMSTSAQLVHKETTLLEQLKHFGKVTPENLLKPLSAGTVGYRRKARLGCKFVVKKNKLLIGFREKRSRFLADLKRCIVLHPSVGKHLVALKELIYSLACYSSIPQIEVAVGDSETALIFRHLNPISEEDQNKIISFADKEKFQIYLQPNPPAMIKKLWPADNNYRLRYTLPDYKIEFLFHPLDFTQINLEINKLMVKQALELLDLDSEDTVLDLFCGIGNFTLPIALKAAKAIGVESNVEMVNRAQGNALHNDIQNAVFLCADLYEPTAFFAWQHETYNKILLDPPRTGAANVISTHFKNHTATKIVYVSCNPATLARDAGILVHQHNYKLTAVGVMDMFPHTTHVEAMALFEKKG